MPINSSADLLNLLATCEPDNALLEKEAQIETLVSMPAYQDLAANKEFEAEFNKYYAPDVLEKMPLARIRRARGAVLVVADCLRAIQHSLRYGPAPELTPDDAPDFYSAASMQALMRKLSEGGEQVNYTNIPKERFMEIFSSDTIRDGRALFGDLTEGSGAYALELQEAAQGKPFCISEAQMVALTAEYEEVMDYLTHEATGSTDSWLGSWTHRLLVAAGVFAAVFAVCWLTGMADNLVGATSWSISLVLGILFVVWG